MVRGTCGCSPEATAAVSFVSLAAFLILSLWSWSQASYEAPISGLSCPVSLSGVRTTASCTGSSMATDGNRVTNFVAQRLSRSSCWVSSTLSTLRLDVLGATAGTRPGQADCDFQGWPREILLGKGLWASPWTQAEVGVAEPW